VEEIRYPRRRFAELLGLAEKDLAAAEDRLGLPAPGQEGYGLEDLSTYRSRLGIRPSPPAHRRQLFLNFKGGTGKTSLSTAYAFRLAEMGHHVLLIDLDSQGHATKCSGFEGEEQEFTLYDVLVGKKPIAEVVLKTPLDELHLIPSNLRMSTIDLALMPMSARELRLRRALESVVDSYDFVIFDAPPSFGLLNLNAIMAADDLFVPVLPDFLSFHGLRLLFETVAELEEDLDHHLQQIVIVLNAFNPTTNIAKAAREALETHYGEYLAKTVVRQCTKFAQASGEGIPIFLHDPSSKGASDVQELIDELMERLAPSVAREQVG
jgi:chromosome partitioning protein